MGGDSLHDFGVPVSEQTGHLTGCPVQEAVAMGGVDVDAFCGDDDGRVEGCAVVEEGGFCCFFEGDFIDFGVEGWHFDSQFIFRLKGLMYCWRYY